MRSFAMMELTTNCALIVTLVSLVTATPYGYGVKGGSGLSATAASSGVADTFGSRGDIPPGTAFGTGYSGSFSKSSSSSSSSSSASSSSSSGSFSYTGYGDGGLKSPGTSGCAYGICPNSGAITEHQGPNGAAVGAGIQGYNADNSVAIGGVPSANCQGSHCNEPSAKCSSGQCDLYPSTENSPTGYDSTEKCKSGQCESTLPSGPSATQYDDSDDIRFVGHSSKSYDSKDQSSDDKIRGFDCRNSNCSPSTTNTQPIFTNGPTNSNYNTNPSNNAKPANSNSKATSGYNFAATHLETPNPNSNCKSGRCKTDYSKPGYESLPTSYSVPIHNTYDSNEQKNSCVNGKCDDQQKGIYSSTTSNPWSTNYLGPHDLHSPKEPSDAIPTLSCIGPNCGSSASVNTVKLSNEANCNSPNCYPHYTSGPPIGSTPQPGQNSYSEPNDKGEPSSKKLPVYTGGFGGPSGILKPNEYKIPVPESHQPIHPTTTINQKPTLASACNTPGCSSPVSSSGIIPPSYYDNNKPSIPTEKQPIYTGGFGGPAGILKPNDFNFPTSTTSKPVHFANPTYNSPSPAITDCKTPNCIGSSPTVGFISTTTQPGSHSSHKESVSGTISHNDLPTYTGGFGGPPGMLKPDEFDIKVPTNEFDIKVPVHSSNPLHHSHPPPPLTSCNTPHCNGYVPVTDSKVPVKVPSGSYGAPSELPPYTGSFGGPPGILKPNEIHVPQTALHSLKPTYSDASPNLTPISNTVSGCKTPSCVLASVGENTVPKPIVSPHPSSIVFPGYTSNYRPVGISYSSAPPVAPITPSANTPSSTYFDKCKTGNCVTTSGFDSNTPSGSYADSAGCKTGNCVGYPTGGDDDIALLTNPNVGGKPVSSQYIGGFDKPSDSVTPNDYTFNIPSTGSSSTDCKSANCAASQFVSNTGPQKQIPTYTDGFGAPPGFLKPNDYSKPGIISKPNKPLTGISPPHTCASGKCDSSPSSTGYNIGLSGAHATASSSASANAIVYSGGFGGPPGLLTPYDSGKVDLSKTIGGQNQGSYYGSANTPNAGVGHITGTPSNTAHLGGSGVGATAASGSIANTNSGTYGYNPYRTHQAGNGIKGGSPCGGSCGSGYQDSSQGSGNFAAAGAKSLSSSNAFGSGGSYASSSASAYTSAGAYTKGGYGKR